MDAATTAGPIVGRKVDIDPAEFRHLGDFYQGPSRVWHEVYASDHRELERELEALGITAWLGHVSGCEHCGARFNHGACYLHLPTGTVVSVGQTCSANTFGKRDKAALAQHRLAKAHERAAERERVDAERGAWIAEHGEVYDHLIKFAPGNSFYTDLLTKLNRWGSLSERQTEAVIRNRERAVQRAAQWAEREAADAAAIAAGVRCPEGRVTITGTVISVKWQDNDFGGREVMTVADDAGFRVWGSAPSIKVQVTDDDPESPFFGETETRYLSIERGDRITFTAAVQPSDGDPLFGFYKRPTRAQVLS